MKMWDYENYNIYQPAQAVQMKMDFRDLTRIIRESCDKKVRAIRNNSDLHKAIMSAYATYSAPFVPYDDEKDARIKRDLKKAGRKKISKKFLKGLPYSTAHLRDSWKVYADGTLVYSAYGDNGFNYAWLQYSNTTFKHKHGYAKWDVVFESSPAYQNFMNDVEKLLTEKG